MIEGHANLILGYKISLGLIFCKCEPALKIFLNINTHTYTHKTFLICY